MTGDCAAAECTAGVCSAAVGRAMRRVCGPQPWGDCWAIVDTAYVGGCCGVCGGGGGGRCGVAEAAAAAARHSVGGVAPKQTWLLGTCPCLIGKRPCLIGQCPCLIGKCPCCDGHLVENAKRVAYGELAGAARCAQPARAAPGCAGARRASKYAGVSHGAAPS